MSNKNNAGIEIPRPGSVWKHTSGAHYVVLLIANKHSEQPDRYPVTVVYRSIDQRVWSRPLSDWFRSMTILPEQGEFRGDAA
jgi:hypothetical protein